MTSFAIPTEVSTHLNAGRRVLNAIRFLKDPDGSSVSEIKKCLSSHQQMLNKDELNAFIKVAVKNGVLEKNGRKYKIVEKAKKKAVDESMKNLKRGGNAKNKLPAEKRKRLGSNDDYAVVVKERKKAVGKKIEHPEKAEGMKEIKTKLPPGKRKRLETNNLKIAVGKTKQAVGEISKREKRTTEKKDAKNKTSPKKRRRHDPTKAGTTGDNLDVPETAIPSVDLTLQSSTENDDSQLQENSEPNDGLTAQKRSTNVIEDVLK